MHPPCTQSSEWLGPGKDTKCIAHLGLCPCRAPENLRSLDLGSAQNAGPTWHSALIEHPGPWAVWTWEVHTTLGFGKTSIVHTLQHSPHMPVGICLQCLSLSTTEQVSLNKCSPSPPHVRAEIRHWRDLHAEEAKISKEKGITLEVTDATDWNPAVNAETVHLRGNYRLWEQLQPRTKDCLTLNWPHTAHNSSRQIPRYIFTIITF